MRDLSEIELGNVSDEITAIKKIKNSNMINFIAGWFDDENKIVVMITDLISNKTLREHLLRIGPPRLKVIKCWLCDILNCLDYLHKLTPPLAHQEINLDNIFVDKKNGNIKLGICSFLNKKDRQEDLIDFGKMVIDLIYHGKKKKTDKSIIEDIINNDSLVELIENSLKGSHSAESLLKSSFFDEEQTEKDSKPVQFKSYRYKNSIVKKILNDIEKNNINKPIKQYNSNCKTYTPEPSVITLNMKCVKKFSQQIEKSKAQLKNDELFKRKSPQIFPKLSQILSDYSLENPSLKLKFTLVQKTEKELKINLTIKREDWKFKKGRCLMTSVDITFNYDLKNDNPVKVAQELKEQINLNQQELDFVKCEIKSFCKGFNSSKSIG